MNFDPVLDLSRSSRAWLHPLPVSAFALRDSFWQPRRECNRQETLPSQFQKLRNGGYLHNFRRASGEVQGPFRGHVAMDSDLYKWLEAAASTLGTHPSSELEAMVDETIGVIESAQQRDGYLNTAFMFESQGKRWQNLRDGHEMYCAGHLIQAAVAHHRATGSPRLLGVARRLADHLCNTFGPEDEGKRPGTCGHPEVEMALVELFRATGEERYLQQARFLVAMRGQSPSVCYAPPEQGDPFGPRYYQDHVPYADLKEVTGHAVRMMYLACGAADIALETGDEALQGAMQAQWRNMTERRISVNGGLGARHEGEAFGRDFELPNARAYNETCAAIASVMWNFRLLHLHGQARFADLLEHTLYNAVLPGLSLDGHCYFYVNPLADEGTHRRQEWFGCACCPPNLARLLAQLPGYFASATQHSLWLHLYASGQGRAQLEGGQTIEWEVNTNYPWDGDITVTIGSEGRFGLCLRVPGWCEGARVEVNGEPFEKTITSGSYVELVRDWKRGEVVHLRLPMPVRRLVCHRYVPENGGRVALMRGPILYAVESVDFPGGDVRDLLVPEETTIAATFEPGVLNGVIVLRGEARVESATSWQEEPLYRSALAVGEARTEAASFAAMPYFAWANRDAGQMQVWLRQK